MLHLISSWNVSIRRLLDEWPQRYKNLNAMMCQIVSLHIFFTNNYFYEPFCNISWTLLACLAQESSKLPCSVVVHEWLHVARALMQIKFKYQLRCMAKAKYFIALVKLYNIDKLETGLVLSEPKIWITWNLILTWPIFTLKTWLWWFDSDCLGIVSN